MASKDLDRIFSDKLMNLDMEPSSQAMESMDRYFRIKSRKKVIRYISIAASISLITIFTGGMIYSYIQNNNSKQVRLAEERSDFILENDGFNNHSKNESAVPPIEDRRQVIKTGKEVSTPENQMFKHEIPEIVKEDDPGSFMASNNDLSNNSEPEASIQALNEITKVDSTSQFLAVTEQNSSNEKMENEVVEENFPIVIIYKPGKRTEKKDTSILASGNEKKKASLKDISEFARNMMDKSPTLGDIRNAKEELLAFDFLRMNKSKTQNDRNNE